jgi:hypothetical protein
MQSLARASVDDFHNVLTLLGEGVEQHVISRSTIQCWHFSLLGVRASIWTQIS